MNQHTLPQRKKVKPQRSKVRLTVECSPDERAYIKMLAAREHKTISEFLLDNVREMLPSCCRRVGGHTPNAETIEALLESREGKLESYNTLKKFWEAMGIDPNA